MRSHRYGQGRFLSSDCRFHSAHRRQAQEPGRREGGARGNDGDPALADAWTGAASVLAYASRGSGLLRTRVMANTNCPGFAAGAFSLDGAGGVLGSPRGGGLPVPTPRAKLRPRYPRGLFRPHAGVVRSRRRPSGCRYRLCVLHQLFHGWTCRIAKADLGASLSGPRSRHSALSSAEHCFSHRGGTGVPRLSCSVHLWDAERPQRFGHPLVSDIPKRSPPSEPLRRHVARLPGRGTYLATMCGERMWRGSH